MKKIIGIFNIFLLFLIFTGCQPTVVKETQKSEFRISKAMVKLFTSSKNGTEPEFRVYNKKFKKELTDYIWYELYIERDPSFKDFRPIEIEEKWFKIEEAGKKLISTKSNQLYMLKDNFNFEFCAGYKPENGFSAGSYLLEIVYNSKTLTNKEFKIK